MPHYVFILFEENPRRSGSVRVRIPLEAELLKIPQRIFEKCVCVRPHALRKLRTYDVVFSNDA